ncbi:MAG TPA: precorrin-6y C5,15-methyltransferase (decarboxylating) subunit CbiE, partial [Streptosporangiaceae bacterium]
MTSPAGPASTAATVTVIGCDGQPLPSAAAQALAAASAVAGAPRLLALTPVPAEAEHIPIQRLDLALDTICAHPGPVAVLASGDPGFFGIVRALRARGSTPVVMPAVSSVALAFARLGLDWDDALVLSAHGRDAGPVAAAALAHPKAAILTGPPEAVTGALRAVLRDAGRRVYVAERLGTPDERVRDLTTDPAAQVTDPHVLISLAPAPATPTNGDADHGDADHGDLAGPRWIAGHAGAPATWALPEAEFDHRDSMITKPEVRALALARLG